MSCRPAMLRGCKAGLFIHPVFLSLHFCPSTAYVLMFEISVLLLSELHFDIVIAVYWKSQHAHASALKMLILSSFRDSKSVLIHTLGNLFRTTAVYLLSTKIIPHKILVNGEGKFVSGFSFSSISSSSSSSSESLQDT